MANHVDYFKKCIKILEDLKKDYPDMEISQHYSLATDCGNASDKELYHALQKHKGELEMNTLSNQDLERVLSETDELFREIEPDDENPDDDWREDIND